MRTSACRTCRPSPNSRCRGRGAEAWLNSILTNRIPKAVGRVTLTYLLTKRGGVRAEFTLTRIGPERFYLVSAGALESARFRFAAEAAAGRRQRAHRQGDDAIWRAGARRAALARSARQGRRHRRFEQSVPLADGAAAVDRRGGPAGDARQFRRRTRLRVPSSDRDAELHLRPTDGGGRRVRHQAVRHPRDGFAAAGEILQAGRARTVDRIRRARIGARTLHRSRRRAISSAATRCSPGATRASPTGWSRWKCMASRTPTRAARSR